MSKGQLISMAYCSSSTGCYGNELCLSSDDRGAKVNTGPLQVDVAIIAFKDKCYIRGKAGGHLQEAEKDVKEECK